MILNKTMNRLLIAFAVCLIQLVLLYFCFLYSPTPTNCTSSHGSRHMPSPSPCDNRPDKLPNQRSKNALAVENVAGNIENIDKLLEASLPVWKRGPRLRRSEELKNGTRLRLGNAIYLIKNKLGLGASSAVYAVQRNDSNREYALKVVNLRRFPYAAQTFLHEVVALTQLQGSDYVVTLYDYHIQRKNLKLYLLLERGGPTLAEILLTDPKLNLYKIMNLWYQILQAVNFIHENGIIHSDIKLHNFIRVDDRLRLIDFGMATSLEPNDTDMVKLFHGVSYDYASPESLVNIATGLPLRLGQKSKVKISAKSDIWSLGCILYFMLYKRTPFEHIRNPQAKINAITDEKFEIPFPPLPEGYPEFYWHILQKCLERDAKKRPSCAELLHMGFP